MSKIKTKLFIGNHNYSSWSLRPWLGLRWVGIAFDEVLISLAQPGYAAEGIEEVAAVSPNRKVPALHVDGQVIWDSLAILEWAAEHSPDAGLWPENWRTRALARSAVCEMHSGFAALRNDLPMNIRRRCRPGKWPDATQRDIDRVISLWLHLRESSHDQGPWLCGSRGVVDAYFAPVMCRFRSYGVELPDTLAGVVQALFQDADFLEWEARPLTDSFPLIDDLYPQA